MLWEKGVKHKLGTREDWCFINESTPHTQIQSSLCKNILPLGQIQQPISGRHWWTQILAAFFSLESWFLVSWDLCDLRKGTKLPLPSVSGAVHVEEWGRFCWIQDTHLGMCVSCTIHSLQWSKHKSMCACSLFQNESDNPSGQESFTRSQRVPFIIRLGWLKATCVSCHGTF